MPRILIRPCGLTCFPAAEVLARADAVAEQPRGGRFLPLYGVQFAIKDNIDVAGRPTTAASARRSGVSRGKRLPS